MPWTTRSRSWVYLPLLPLPLTPRFVNLLVAHPRAVHTRAAATSSLARLLPAPRRHVLAQHMARKSTLTRCTCGPFLCPRFVDIAIAVRGAFPTCAQNTHARYTHFAFFPHRFAHRICCVATCNTRFTHVLQAGFRDAVVPRAGLRLYPLRGRPRRAQTPGGNASFHSAGV